MTAENYVEHLPSGTPEAHAHFGNSAENKCGVGPAQVLELKKFASCISPITKLNSSISCWFLGCCLPLAFRSRQCARFRDEISRLAEEYREFWNEIHAQSGRCAGPTPSLTITLSRPFVTCLTGVGLMIGAIALYPDVMNAIMRQY